MRRYLKALASKLTETAYALALRLPSGRGVKNSRNAQGPHGTNSKFEGRARMRLSYIIERMGISLVISMPLTLVCVYLKEQQLCRAGYKMIRRMTGIVPNLEMAAQQQLSVAERMAPFASDLVANLLLVPILLTPILIIRKPMGPIVAAAIASMLIVFVHLQGISIRLMGSLQTYEAFTEALRWGAANTELSKEYIMMYQGAHMKTLAAVVATTIIAYFISKQADLRARAMKWILMASQATVLIICSLAQLKHTETVYHRSFLSQCLNTFLSVGNEGSSKYFNFGLEQCREEYERLTGCNQPTDKTEVGRGLLKLNVGAEQKDVVWIQFETLPAEWADFSRQCEDLPNIRKMAETAIVASDHFSPYAATIPATWSALAGCYPLNETFLRQASIDRNYPSLPALLSKRGYDTALFMPDDLERFLTIFRSLGIARIEASSVMPDGREANLSAIEIRLERDLEMLAKLKRYIVAMRGHERNYFAMFAPQVGHGPWRSPNKIAQNKSPKDLCREILRVQDQWVGEIVRTVEKVGRLDKTIFVLVGDHGIRTKLEDPSLDLSGIDTRTYRVPLMISAPGLIGEQFASVGATSHIDIAPTLARMLGINFDSSWQGRCILETEPRDRIIFLLGRQFNGKDGIVAKGSVLTSEEHSTSVIRGVQDDGIDVDSRCSDLRALLERWIQLHYKKAQ